MDVPEIRYARSGDVGIAYQPFGSDEILVSGTVRDLVAGSLVEFDDHGEHVLRGVPGSRHQYAVRS